MLDWWRSGSAVARRALIAAALGWMLDAFDVMLYALVLASLIEDLGLSHVTAGWLGSITLVASAIGGALFGLMADRVGRVRALTLSVLIYSVFTALCGLATSVWQLAVFRAFLGLGMGGEWACGAALVSETWPAKHRGKALALVQSAWAIGFALAALVTAVVLPRWGWRAVFFVGILPALLTLWVRRNIPEPAIWREKGTRGKGDSPLFRELTPSKNGAVPFSPPGSFSFLRPPLLRLTLALTLMNACTLFAWWGFNLWIPAYLSLPSADGGVGLATETMSLFVVVMQVGMWFGYVTFGYVSDRVGRKRTYVTYLLTAAVLMSLYAITGAPPLLFLLGPFVAFFGTGYFSGFGAVAAEIYPTSLRATALGFTYNLGRVASAFAPFAVGSLSQTRGFAFAFLLTATAFVAASLFWFIIPETRGRELT
ncbi:MAG: MFS transporter [Luteitalea sp.]|nr:MFS transporter [Luteitalea sp.]